MQNVMMKYDSTYVQILVFRWHLPSSFSSPPLVPFFSLGKIYCSRDENSGEREPVSESASKLPKGIFQFPRLGRILILQQLKADTLGYLG